MFGNLGKIMKLASEMKEKMPELQEKLALARFEAEAGGGAVKAAVNGKLALVDVKIDPSALSEGGMDAEMLEDLIKAAISAAQATAAQAAQQAMLELTGGMQLPGMEGMM